MQLHGASLMDIHPRTSPGFVSGGRCRSADELSENALRAASVLATAGVEAGDSVAVMLRNDFPFIEASYAAGALGAVAVPVNWHFKGDEVGYILRDSGAKALVVHADLLGRIEGAVPNGVRVLVVATPPEVAAAYGIKVAPVPPRATDWDAALAAAEPWDGSPRPAPPSMIYTSGTTGKPKGVQRLEPLDLTNPDVATILAVVGILPAMRTVICGPMYHTAPNVHALVAGQTGGLVVLQPRFDAEELLALVERHAITSLHLVPTMLVRLLRLPEDVRGRYDVSSLQVIAHAAAPCPPDVKRAAIAWLGPIVNEYYGGTETGAVVSCTSEEWLARPGTVGSALPGCAVRILDEDGRRLPAGELGDIYLRNRGWGDFTYRGRDADRREIERDGYVTVGDIGYLDEDGYLFLCDRRTNMIISGGVNIYPAEIEAALATHPDVEDCAVFGVPDPEFGEAVAAVIEPRAGAELAPEVIQAYVRESLAGFKVPRVIEFAEELPREDSGKLFKRQLRERYWPAGHAI
jgi:long-chain acyl-CoA synthetase